MMKIRKGMSGLIDLSNGFSMGLQCFNDGPFYIKIPGGKPGIQGGHQGRLEDLWGCIKESIRLSGALRLSGFGIWPVSGCIRGVSALYPGCIRGCSFGIRACIRGVYGLYTAVYGWYLVLSGHMPVGLPTVNCQLPLAIVPLTGTPVFVTSYRGFVTNNRYFCHSCIWRHRNCQFNIHCDFVVIYSRIST